MMYEVGILISYLHCMIEGPCTLENFKENQEKNNNI